MCKTQTCPLRSFTPIFEAKMSATFGSSSDDIFTPVRLLSSLNIPSGPIPVGTFALRTDAGFILSIPRNPFMLAPLALVLINRYFLLCHAPNIYLKGYTVKAIYLDFTMYL